jgi:hypothetical protein
MSSSDESKLPDNVITVDFRRRVVMTESGEKPVPTGGGTLVTLPFGGPQKTDGAESAARAQARLLSARSTAPSSEPVVAEKPKRAKKASTLMSPDGEPAAPAPAKPRAKKAEARANELATDALAPVGKLKKSASKPKKAASAPASPSIPMVPPVSFLSMEKLGRFQAFIKEHLTAVTFDTRVAGVEVPRQFRGVPRLILNFSHNFHIPDFAYDEQGVRATLSFDTGDFFVQIPWDAIYAMMVPKTKEAAMWDVSVPVELAALIPALRRSLFPNGPF